jgi:hypothetical protein
MKLLRIWQSIAKRKRLVPLRASRQLDAVQLGALIMADVNQVYQSEFLRAAQLGGQVRRVTIEAVTTEILGQGEKAAQKIVLKLAGVKQRLALNKTNAQTLASVWGPNTDHWIGRQIDLRPEKILFAGKMVDTIGVQPVVTTAPAPAKAVPATPAAPPGDAAGPNAWPEEVVDDRPWDAA